MYTALLNESVAHRRQIRRPHQRRQRSVGRKTAVATTLAAAAPAISQVSRSPWGNTAESPERRLGSGLAVELLRLLINFDQLTVATKTG